MTKKPRVAIIHDYLNAYGGQEAVTQAIWELFPNAPIYTALWDKNAFKGTGAFEKADVRVPKWATGKIINRFYKYFVPLYPLMFENLDLSEYDLIISSSSNFAKGVTTNKNQLHISYIHTPPRFLYGYPTETSKRDVWYWKPILKVVDYCLLKWDQRAAQKPGFLLCNSQEVQQRIKRFYKRDAVIINPFIALDDQFENIPAEKGDYYLYVGRLSLYKNVDKIIQACSSLNRKLKIAGSGKEFGRFKNLTTSVDNHKNIEMLGFVSEEKKSALLKGCRAFIYPVEYEDFGMVPLEAMYFGKPAIVLNQGGFKDYLEDGKNGVFIEKPTAESLITAIKKFESLEHKVDWRKNCKETAKRFTKERFQKEFREFVENKWNARIT